MSEQVSTPADRPEADVVIYDGQCPLCTATVQQLAAWDRFHRLAFIPLQDPEVTRRWPFLNREHLMKQIHLISSPCRIYRGAEVLRVLTRRIPRLWPLAPLVHLPGSLPVWQWLYGVISRARYLLGRRKARDAETCSWHRGHS